MSSEDLTPIEAARAILEARRLHNEEASDLVEHLEEVEEDFEGIEEEQKEMKPKKPNMSGDKGAAVEKDASGKSSQDAQGKGPIIGTDKGTEGKDKKNKASISMKSSDASGKIEKPKMTATAEHMEALFNGEDLSEEFKDKATTIFEAAVNDALGRYSEALEEAYEAQLMETAATIEENLTDSLNDYLDYVVENWIQENEVAIERGIRAEVAESFMSGLRDLFANHYIDIPEEKFDVVEGLVNDIEELQNELNEEIERNMAIREANESLACELTFRDMTEGMVDTDIEKLRSLSEGIEFDNAEQFADKLEVLRENYFKKVNGGSEVSFITEETEEDGDNTITEEISGPMSYYAQAISRTVKK